MFSRAAPVGVEEIENAEALFGNNTRQHNLAYAQENGAITIAALASRAPVLRLITKENNHVTQKHFVHFARFNRRADHLGVRSRRLDARLRFGDATASMQATTHSQQPDTARLASPADGSHRLLDYHQQAALLQDRREPGYFQLQPE
jgi:hypothetical protein